MELERLECVISVVTREFACGTSNIATRSVVSEFPRARRDHSPIHFPLIYRCSFMFSPAHVPVSARTRRSRHSGPAEDPRSRSRADEAEKRPERTLYQPHRSSCVKWKNKSVRHGSKRNEFCIAQDDYAQAPCNACLQISKKYYVVDEINSRECRIGIGLCTRRPRHDLHQHGKGSLLRHEVVGGPL